MSRARRPSVGQRTTVVWTAIAALALPVVLLLANPAIALGPSPVREVFPGAPHLPTQASTSAPPPSLTPSVGATYAFDTPSSGEVGRAGTASQPLGAISTAMPFYAPARPANLQPNVVILTNQTSNLLSTHQGSEYVFAANASQLASIHAGDIIASPFVNPFMINVTSIRLTGSGYAVYGNTTPLASAFPVGNYTIGSIDPINQVTLSQDWWSGSIQIAVSGSVSINSAVTIGASTCWYYVVPGVCLSFSNSFTLSATLGISVTGATAIQAKATLAEIPLGCIDVYVGCIIPNLEIAVGVQVQAQNQYSASATYTTGESSAVYQSSCFLCNPSWHTSDSYSQSSLSFSQNLAPSVSIEAFADVPNLGFFFDYIAGPYVEVQPGLQFTTTFSSSAINWNLALTLVLNLGLETAWWLGGTSLSVSVGPWSWPLASGSFTSYSVRFSESGLPAGAPWSVTVDGVWTQSSSSTSIVIAVPTGSNTFAVSGYDIYYPYAIYAYTPSPGSGTVHTATTITIQYSFHVIVTCQGVRGIHPECIPPPP